MKGEAERFPPSLFVGMERIVGMSPPLSFYWDGMKFPPFCWDGMKNEE